VNLSALVAIFLFAGALLLVFGLVYQGAARSRARGELSNEGIRVLRWALLGQLIIFVVLGITAFLT
jgi:cytochrome bd-type quinol oxidase subunit 2